MSNSLLPPIVYTIAVFLGIWILILTPQIPAPQPPVMKAGNFVTFDKLNLSLYITRMVKDEHPTVCFVQQNVTDLKFFENCVWVVVIEDVMKKYNGRITDTCVYNRVME